jgi:hypothetical protein
MLLGQYGQRRQNEPGPVPAADEHDERGQEQHRGNRIELAEDGRVVPGRGMEQPYAGEEQLAQPGTRYCPEEQAPDGNVSGDDRRLHGDPPSDVDEIGGGQAGRRGYQCKPE